MAAGGHERRFIPSIKAFQEKVLQYDFFKDIFDDMVVRGYWKLTGAEEAEVHDVPKRKGEGESSVVQKIKSGDWILVEEDLGDDWVRIAEPQKLKGLCLRLTPLGKDTDSKVFEQVDSPEEEPKREFTSVPLHFDNEQHYLGVFFPLFVQEAKMQIFRDKSFEMERETEQVEIDRFQLESNGFLKLEMSRSRVTEVSYRTHDLVILTDKVNPLEKTDLHFLAFVDDRFMREGQLHLVAKVDKNQEETRALKVSKAISENAPWRLAKVCGMSTLIREYEGLVSLPHIPLRNLILNRADRPAEKAAEMQAAPAVPGLNEDGGVGADGATRKAVTENTALLQLPPALEAAFKAKYNPSQLNAILDSRKVSGITLVQGPPGTGKTTTILGILGMLSNAKATASAAVSYSRTGNRAGETSKPDDDMSSSEDEQDTDIAIQERQKERLKRMRMRMPWLRAGYVPWADSIEQELSGPNNKRLRTPYVKLGQKDVVPMSEIKEDVTPQKVLVCAPSNAAIDEVIRRALSEGIAAGDGALQKASLIRLGPNVHPSLSGHSLESIARRKVKESAESATKNLYEEMKSRLMREKRILCTTLSVSGSRDLVGFQSDLDTVVIDEASQGVEISTLVPIKLGCKRLILVGDPQQLPATCFSAVAKRNKYEQSLFQRLQLSGHTVNLLDMQFRMHPAISSFPSSRFYEGRIINGRGLQEFEKEFPAPWSKIPCYGPVAFFNLQGEMERESVSWVNEAEADFVVQLFCSVSKSFPPTEDWRSKIAVISPYAEQVKLIRQKFRQLYSLGKAEPCPVDVNTVDGFQGREKDAVIVSTVRTEAGSGAKGIGFVRDKRRMNVAFTRARKNLWVVGNPNTLRVNEDWNAFIKEQESAARMLRVSPPFDTFFSRYLDRWFARHPNEPRLDGMVRPAPAVDADAGASDGVDAGQGASDGVDDAGQDTSGFAVSDEKLEELRREEAARELSQRKDVEEVDSDYEAVEPDFKEQDPGRAESKGESAAVVESVSVDQEGLVDEQPQAASAEDATMEQTMFGEDDDD